jgi:hypothetical protein
MKSGTGTEEKKKILPPTSERPAKGAPPEHLSDSSIGKERCSVGDGRPSRHMIGEWYQDLVSVMIESSRGDRDQES